MPTWPKFDGETGTLSECQPTHVDSDGPIISNWRLATGQLGKASQVRAAAARVQSGYFIDPLDEDAPGDEVVITTRRGIARVALVAAETATRFERDGIEHEPVAWMLAPRRAFGGASAIERCLDREPCLRGVLLHRLGLGLDADLPAVDAFIASDDDDEFDAHEFHYLYGGHRQSGEKREKWRDNRRFRVRLYTATIIDTRDNRMTQVFHASLARDAAEVRTRLAGRFGPDVANLADIRLGIHVTSPPVVALVPAAVVELIQRMERDCAKPFARSFAVDIEMGIQA